MPRGFKSGYGRTRAKRNFWKAARNRRFSKFKRNRYVNRKIAMNPAMKKYVCKMRYFDQFVLNSGAGGTAANYVFHTNNIYDPNLTGIGHSVLGYTEMMTLYNNYYVRSCRMKAIFTSTGDTDTNSDVYIVSITHAPDNWAATTAGELIEAKRGKWGMLTSSDAIGMKTLTCNAYPAAMLRTPYRDDSLIGENGGAPAKQSYFVVSAIPQAATADAGDVRVSIVMDFTVEWTDPKKLGQS